MTITLFRASKTTTLTILLLLLAGCRTAQKDVTEIDTILKTVSYDTSVPASPAPSKVQTTSLVEPIDTNTTMPDRVQSVQKIVSKGFRTTVGVVMFGVIKVVESALGNDDDDEDSTPRGKADQNLRQWIDERDRWRSDD
jgi:hypothetical protein